VFIFRETKITALGLGMLLSACVSLFSDRKVLDRSTAEQPEWAKNKHGSYFLKADGLYYTYHLPGMPVLSLALKQAQYDGLLASAAALETKAKRRIAEMTDMSKVQGAQAAEFDRALDDQAAQFVKREARIEDIYFEKYEQEDEEGRAMIAHDVSVLVQLPAQKMDIFYAQFFAQLARSSSPQLKSLGQTLLKAPIRQ
jgi:hypothetical protein